MEKHLHIISLDVPYPADYGGVIDIFYKIKCLYEAGIKIHLHCFTQGRPPQDELDNYCEQVFYYKRKNFLQALPLNVPFMIGSRSNTGLLQNLQKDNYPVLIEGVQSSYLLLNGFLKDRIRMLRLHNVEFLYYRKLAQHESNWLKKLYYKNECRLLKKTEAELASMAPVITLSKTDLGVYKKFFGASQVHQIPVFTPWKEVNIEEGRGKYCLYHGNLAINENEQSVKWLLENVFVKTDIALIVAGKNPSERLQKFINAYPNCSLIENPTDTDLQQLIRKAHINVLPSFNVTGIKLKLLNALYNGRFCIVNYAAIKGSDLEGFVDQAETAEDFLKKLQSCFQNDFTTEDISNRKKKLYKIFDNKTNTEELIKFLFNR
jgi:glycosyltransferase involved in cell wall biosynthesis